MKTQSTQSQEPDSWGSCMSSAALNKKSVTCLVRHFGPDWNNSKIIGRNGTKWTQMVPGGWMLILLIPQLWLMFKHVVKFYLFSTLVFKYILKYIFLGHFHCFIQYKATGFRIQTLCCFSWDTTSVHGAHATNWCAQYFYVLHKVH